MKNIEFIRRNTEFFDFKLNANQAENFYKQDKKLYNLSTNEDFKKLYNELVNLINNERHETYDIYDLQNLIDKLSIWYEFKYPDLSVSFLDLSSIGMSKFQDLSDKMNYYQMLNSFPNYTKEILDCFYRMGCIRVFEIRNICNKKIPVINFYINQNGNSSSIYIDSRNGIIYEANINGIKINYNDKVSLEEFYNMLISKFPEEKENFSELLKVINIHKKELELRKEILRLTALKILYSKDTIATFGYRRAIIFINEMNKEISNLNLSTKEIDNIVSKDYSFDESNKTFVDDDENKKTFPFSFFKNRRNKK